MNKILNLIFEAAVVKRLERTGWQVLGDNRETVGEHTFMTAVIAYLMAKEKNVDMEKVLLMSIFHDFHESRIGEADKIHTFYVTRDTARANLDIFSDDPSLHAHLVEYEKKESLEARIVYEANILALLVEVKKLVENGNENAKEWLTENAKRVRIPESAALADAIQNGNTQDWWRDIREKLTKIFEA